MAKRQIAAAAQVLDTPDSTVLDLVDHLLNKGVVAEGDVTLGVAGIDLIYVRLAALLCAADRVLPRDPTVHTRKRRHHQPGVRKSR
jgi:gas vesicle structural protein